MRFVEAHYLYFIIIGLFFMSISLHFKTEDKDLKYGFLGWAENLTNKGKSLFFYWAFTSFSRSTLGNFN